MEEYNFHTHTKRCGHAVGEDREYIESAIKNGYQVLGMSDHCPHREISLPRQRMEWKDYPSYLETFEKLKKKYAEQINLFVGFECESYQNHIDQLKELKNHCDYLILGQHHYIKGNKTYSYQTEQELEQMVKDMEYGIQENLFLYLAHPDYYLRERPIWDEAAIKACHAICKLCVKYDLPMELNYNGMLRQNEQQIKIHYPYDKFWEIASSYGCKVCIGIDAHDPKRFVNKTYFDDIEVLITRYQLKKLTKEELIDRIRK